MALFGTMGGLQSGLMAALNAPGTMSAEKVPTPEPRQRGRGLFGGLRRAFDPSRIAMMQATLSGDYGAAAQIHAQQQRLRTAQAEAEREAEQAAAMEAARAQALEALGYTKPQIAAMRPEEASRLVFERFQTRQFGPEGGSVRNIGPDGQPTFDQAPWQRQIGRSVIGQQPGGPVSTIYEGVEPVSVQPGGGLYGVTGSGDARTLIDPAGAAPPLTVPPPAAQGGQVGPPPGAVVNGYRFRGGNPNDRNNWEPVAQGGAGPSGPRNFR